MSGRRFFGSGAGPWPPGGEAHGPSAVYNFEEQPSFESAYQFVFFIGLPTLCERCVEDPSQRLVEGTIVRGVGADLWFVRMSLREEFSHRNRGVFFVI